MSKEKLTLDIDELLLENVKASDNWCPYVIVKFGTLEFKTSIQEGTKVIFGDSFDLADANSNDVVVFQVWDSTSNALIGERTLCIDQLKIGMGVDEKYKVLKGCYTMGEIRIVSKYVPSTVAQKIGEFYIGKVETERVIWDAPVEIKAPVMQVASQFQQQQQAMNMG